MIYCQIGSHRHYDRFLITVLHWNSGLTRAGTGTKRLENWNFKKKSSVPTCSNWSSVLAQNTDYYYPVNPYNFRSPNMHKHNLVEAVNIFTSESLPTPSCWFMDHVPWQTKNLLRSCRKSNCNTEAFDGYRGSDGIHRTSPSGRLIFIFLVLKPKPSMAFSACVCIH